MHSSDAGSEVQSMCLTKLKYREYIRFFTVTYECRKQIKTFPPHPPPKNRYCLKTVCLGNEAEMKMKFNK